MASTTLAEGTFSLYDRVTHNPQKEFPEELPIYPFKGRGRLAVNLPGSKSITNRALVLAVLHPEATILEGVLFSGDTCVMIACLRALGFDVAPNEAKKTITVNGLGGEIPNTKAEIFVENAGTVARFITALLALRKNGEYSLDGTPAMRKRPMKGLLEALQKLGCEITFLGEKWHFPFTMKTHGIEADSVSVDASASSQILSALLLIAPCIAKHGETFSLELTGETVSHPFVDMTLRMIREFGGAVEPRGKEFVCGGGYPAKSFEDCVYEIEPDATAASYFAMLPFLHEGSTVEIPGLVLQGGLQGDSEFIVKLSTPPHDLLSLEETPGAIKVSRGSSRDGFDMDFNAISDTFLTLAAIAPLLNSPLTIRGIAHTRKQETDRINAFATEVAKIVGENNVSQTEDSLTVSPCALNEIRSRADACDGGMIVVETYNDHRIAMSFAVLGTYDLRGDGTPWIKIKDPACCAKTFPNFFEELRQV